MEAADSKKANCLAEVSAMNLSMRVGTWNCQTGLDSNWGVVEALDADVVTVQECGAGVEAQAKSHEGWTCEWQPGRWHKGLAVLARPPYRIESREDLGPSSVSAIIFGPDRFRFVGFWAMTPKDAGFEYPEQAMRLIERLPVDDLPTVVAGDFNASKSVPHLSNVERLRARGLVSAYHALHGVPHKAFKEQHPTSYYRWRKSRGYHMDFVFVPYTWRIESVEVGTYEDYPGMKLSDHVPVIVTVHPQ
jgi:endonuclease/exonuclease/phosphatase family metal-dependent hydrolase